MSGLISEIEAFTAWKNGQDVEIYDESMCWHPLLRDHGLCVFDSNGRVKFRLKPRAITINGIEVPAPFKPKEGDEVYFIDCETGKGYSSDFIGHGCLDQWIQFGAWRSEEEIKQVITALRKVFNDS